MIYDIYLFKGLADVHFGMSYKDVRKKLSGEFRSYNPGAGFAMFEHSFPVDDYEKKGLVCHYDREGYLEALEFDPPARPTLEGIDLLILTMKQAGALFKALDPEVEADEDEIKSVKLSVGALAADYDEGEDAFVGRILFGRPGYYDESA
jgi:hypothetical protein